ncbi:MAG: regulatory protein RecX [Chloroflexi bacterium]|nr:regulatory protein RecX [Chloroflexota bacterium]
MKRITAIRTREGQRKRADIFSNKTSALNPEAEEATGENRSVEQEQTTAQTETPDKSDNFDRCFKTATRYLSYRPRSEFELRERLCQRSFANDTIESVLVKLKEQGMVDDMALAQFWTSSRELNPRSRWLTGRELKQKGVANDIIEQAVKSIDDDASAYRAGLAKARSLPRSDYESFRRRLGEFLKRRGFSYAVINHTVKRLWQEGTSDSE